MLCDLIIQHGQKEIFLEVFDHLITHPNQDTLDIQKKVLLNLFDDHYADRLNPFNPRLGRDNKYRNCFAPDKNPLSYTYKFLEVLSKCLKGNVGVTLISRVYKFIKIKDLVELLYKSTQREKEILEEIIEPTKINPTKDIQTAKISIIEILLIFFSAFPQSIDELSDCTKTLIDDFTMETRQLQSKDIKADYLTFVFEKLLPLVILYSENFLKESRVIDKNELGRDIYQNETINKRCILNITNVILKNLEDFSLKIDLNETHITNIARIASTMKIQFPQILKEFINNMEQDQTHVDETIAAGDSSPAKMSKSQKASQMKRSLRTSGRGLGGSSGGTGAESGYQSEYSIQEELKMSKSRKKTSVSEVISKHNNPSDQLTSLWRNFKEKLIDDKYFKKSIKKDLNVLSNSLLNFSTAFVESEDKELREFFISGEDLFIKLMNYLQFWIQKKANKASVIFLVKALSRIIKNSMDDEDALIERQNMFDRLNTTKILMVLIWEEKNHDTQYLYSIFKFMIRILLGGNPIVQKTIADLFMSSSISERFFRKVNDLILREIAQIDFSSKYNVSKEISHLGKQLLRLLQLFCEGHNLTLQNYLRQQTNSKTNYDIVTLITKLLCAYKVNSKNFESVMQCFDTLTELTQGPCQANQIAIINSKFLEFAVSLLNEEDKAIDYSSTGLDIQSGKSFRTSRTSGMTRDFQSMKTSQNAGSAGLSLSHTGSLIPPKTSSASGFRRKRMKITLEQLTKVKHKCLITLVSLLEGNNTTLNLSTRIMRAIPISVLTDNLVQVYRQYKRLYKNKGYTEAAFNHHQEDYKPDKKQAAEFIIENGFNIYILINLFLDNQAYKSIEDDDLNDYIDDEKNIVATVFDEGIIGELRKFWISLFSNVLGAVEMVKKNVIDRALKDGDMDEEEAKLLKEEIEKKQMVQEAISFFRSNMGHIEIVRNGNLEKIYFPILPYCKYLSKDLKADFQDTVNRTSTKTKVADLIQRSDELIKNMKHEEKMAHFLNHYKIFGLITNHVKLWEYSAFIIGVALNIIIIASYSNNLPGGKSEPYLFFNVNNHDMQTITTLGVLNLVFTSLVVAHFFLKRAPVLVADIWEGFLDQPFRLIKTPLIFIKKVIFSFIRGLQDFDILQNCCIILFAILGLAVHPFFFFFMLTYFVRIDLLKNVLKAVWEPRVPLVLTILVFFLAEYYFSLIGYIAFYTNYNGGKTCESLWECYLTTIDQTFKQTGAVGAYLVDPDMLIKDANGDDVLNPNEINWARFFFDNAFKIIIVLIIVNLIAGIIIDKFGALKESLQEKEEDMTQRCFICGIEREKLDKSSDNKQGFDSHIKKDHYMWNYVFYKAYLKFKEPTEYDGNESYIADKIQNFDSVWFPINRAMAIQDEESEINARIERVSKIAKQVMDIKTSLRSNISRMNHLAETMDKYKHPH